MAALLCMGESPNRFESASNERAMTVKVLHVLGRREWNSEYRFSGRVIVWRCHSFSNLLAEVADVK